MAKITMLPVTNVNGPTNTNANFERIAQELNDKVLYRNNTSGETNTMENNLDMNGKKVFNLPAPTAPNEAARLADVQLANSGQAAAVFTQFTPYDYVSSGNVQGAIQQVVDHVNEIYPANLPYMAQTVGDKLAQTVSIRDFGGRDDDTTDNYAAAIAARTAVGPKGRIIFPRREVAGVYYFATNPFFDDVELDVDPTVRLRGPLSLSEKITATRTTRVDIELPDSGFTDHLTSTLKLHPYEKNLYMGDGDLDNSRLVSVNTSGADAQHYIHTLGFDTFDAGTPSTFSNLVTWTGVPSDGRVRLTLVPVVPGDELVSSFADIGVYNRVAYIRTAAGYYFFSSDGSGALPRFGGKIGGGPFLNDAIDYTGRARPQYEALNTSWGIKIYDANHFSILLNGMEVTDVHEVFGDIVSAGFGVQSISGTRTLSIGGWTIWKDKPMASKRNTSILFLGDSMTASHHGGWPQILREMLDGSYGIRVDSIINESISGQNTAGMLNVLQTKGLQGAKIVAIPIGTNDMQYNSDIATMTTNLVTMGNICRTGGAIPVFWIPPTWYTYAQSGGGGTGAQTPGSPHIGYMRSYMLRILSDNGFKVCDIASITGPVIPEYLSSAQAGSLISDNIHPSILGYKVIAWAMARAIAGAYVFPVTKGIRGTRALPFSSSVGWGGGTGPLAPHYGKTSEGWVSLYGDWGATVVADNAVVAAIPLYLAPARFVRFMCITNTNQQAQITIDESGTIRAYTPSGTAVISLNNIQYQAKYF